MTERGTPHQASSVGPSAPSTNRGTSRIAIVCSYPPPYAGMSIYAERLSSYLAERGFDCKVIDIGRENKPGKAAHVLTPRGGRLLKYFFAMWLLARYPADIVHVNCSSYGNLWGSLALCAFCRMLGRNTILGVRGGSFPKRIIGFGRLKRAIVGRALALCDKVICVNSEIRSAVLSLGIHESRLRLIPAFCLHYLSDTVPIEALPDGLVRFCRSHSPVLVSGIALEQAYGWEVSVDAIGALRAKLPEVGLIIMGTGADRPECERLIASNGLSNDVLLAGDLPHPVALTICKEFADIMVRPTFVDGDSSFVREGIALCKPVVASDTDFRPEGVVLFKKGDAEDLAEKVEYALEHSAKIVEELRKMDHPDYFAKTVELYESLLSQRRGHRGNRADD